MLYLASIYPGLFEANPYLQGESMTQDTYTPISKINPSAGYKGYLDVFIFGTTDTVSRQINDPQSGKPTSVGQKSTAGIRNNEQYANGYLWLGDTNADTVYSRPVAGKFWTGTSAGAGAHYPLYVNQHIRSVDNKWCDWAVFVNAGFDDAFGFSVRLVFDAVMVEPN